MAEVLEGTDGYLFIKSDGNNYLAQLTGRIQVSDSALDRIFYTQLSRYLLCKEIGSRYVWAIAPGKERILSDKLPMDIREAVQTYTPPVRQILARAANWDLLSSGGKFFCDLANAFFEFSPRENLYHRTDTHWTHSGAFLAYQYLIQFLAEPLLGAAVTRPRISDASQQGDLGTIAGMGPEKIKYLANPDFGCKRLFDNKVENNGRVEVFEGKYADRPTALILRSSSVDFMREFLLNHFSRVVMLFSPDFSYEFVLGERPDYVFHFQQERYLMRNPEDNASGFITDAVEKKNRLSQFNSDLKTFVDNGGYFLNKRTASETLEIFLQRRI